jgi:hypothetical protein
MMFMATLMGKYGNNKQAHICWARSQMRYITGTATGKSYLVRLLLLLLCLHLCCMLFHVLAMCLPLFVRLWAQIRFSSDHILALLPGHTDWLRP